MVIFFHHYMHLVVTFPLWNLLQEWKVTQVIKQHVHNKWSNHQFHLHQKNTISEMIFFLYISSDTPIAWTLSFSELYTPSSCVIPFSMGQTHSTYIFILTTYTHNKNQPISYTGHIHNTDTPTVTIGHTTTIPIIIFYS